MPEAEREGIHRKIEANGHRCLYIQCDVVDDVQVKRAVQRTFETPGTVDVLVNNAGIMLVAAVEDIPYEGFMCVVSVNLGGTFLLCKHVLPVLKAQRGGAIVNIGSVSGHVGQIDHSACGSTKGAIITFTRALAREVAGYSVGVNSISPGQVDTRMLRGDIQFESDKTGLPMDEVKRIREAEQAFNRWADPVKIGEAIHFLVSDKASFITGTDPWVDCGWVAR